MKPNFIREINRNHSVAADIATQKNKTPISYRVLHILTLFIGISTQFEEYKSLVIVDVQNDFCEEGSLPVKDASSIIPKINSLKQRFKHVFLTQDWHPDNHVSFYTSHQGKQKFSSIIIDNKIQELWPVHCVQNTWGSQFHRDLLINQNDVVIQKGILKNIDVYSGFGTHNSQTELYNWLLKLKIRQLFVVGLAYDFCVLNTAISGFKQGFEVFVIEDCCKAIDATTVHKKYEEYLQDALTKDPKLRKENFQIIPEVRTLLG